MRRFRIRLATAALAATSIAAAAVSPASTAAGQEADEYRVKAAIVYNLAKFVDWPPEAFSSPTAPLDVCVLGVDPFGPTLDAAFKGHLVAGRTASIRRIGEVEPGCHVLFVSTSEQKRIGVIVDQLRTRSVLTISEYDGFSRVGGMIELFTDGDRVRFELNVPALEAARLRASARLREIASGGKQTAGARR
jgi:hypothetical protein